MDIKNSSNALLVAGIVSVGLLSSGQVFSATNASAKDSSGIVRTIKAQIWADNWFALYSGDTLIKQDSEPFEKERSFNTENFTFPITLPAKLSVVMRDHFQNNTGLEYIGTPHQQVGDGGFIAQFVDADTGETLAVSDNSWQCIVTHKAPLNRAECEHSSNPEQVCKYKIDPEPENWKSSGFDYSAWPHATTYTSWDVQPHGDYHWWSWKLAAKFIWSDDLVVDNTVLCRFTIPAPR